ncbi:MAG TPA: cupredoxin domain-containing protein [Nitrososphaeraceae archaeon]|nr:cupredoxin domain-containing protein [Nitrososphaeraceae archaeon]
MIYRIGIFIAVQLILSSVFSLLTIEVVASQIAESNSIIHSVTMVENTSNATGAVSSNNTIILNAAEVGEAETAEEGEAETAEEGEELTVEENEVETYRWVDSNGAENPNLNLISDTEYTIKIDNPTDEEHELIIDSESDGKTSVIAQSPEIEPGKNAEFKFKPNQVGELGYHCEYHPDQMNGTINVSQ